MPIDGKTDAMLPVEEALEIIIAAMPEMAGESCALAHCHGRVLASDIHAAISHPPHAVSAMDGYACHADDAGRAPPFTLQCIGESAAGRPYKGTIGAGECVAVFTGGHCPDGTAAIILQEDTEKQSGDAVLIREVAPPGKYIRKAGNDFARGNLLATAGTRISARLLALLGSAGHGRVAVRKRPLVAIISTGDELVPPGVAPEAHQIVSSNGVYLENLVAAVGGEALPCGIIGDSGGALESTLDKLAGKADLIVTSGGASVGKHDGVARLMAQSPRASRMFGRIAMRPGKPMIFGRFGGVPLLGLPGNPVSTGVCGVIFLAAAIRAMLGSDAMPHYRHAVLGNKDGLAANDARQDYLRARVEYGEDGRLRVAALMGQDSGMMGVFARANALIMRPPHAAAVDAGEIVPVILLAEAM